MPKHVAIFICFKTLSQHEVDLLENILIVGNARYKGN
jgi:hypothetical protein